jgi:hypothetical protein
MLAMLFSDSGIIKYTKYLVVFIGLFYLVNEIKFNNLKFSWLDAPSYCFFLLFFCSLLNYLISDNKEFLHIDIFINLSIGLSFFIAKGSNLRLEKVFIIFCVFFILHFIKSILLTGFDFSYIASFLTTSGSPYENSIASYVFGLFFVFFKMINKRAYVIYSMLGVFICSKRITMAVILLISIMQFFYFFKSKKMLYLTILLCLSLCITISIFITTDVFKFLVIDYFGMSADYLTKGRTYLYSVGLNELNNLSFFSGIGVGSLYSILTESLSMSEYYDGSKVLLHNEVLRLFIELGIVLFLIFFVMMFSPILTKKVQLDKSKNIFYLMLYTFSIATVDNLLVYSIYWFFFFSLYCDLVYPKSRGNK